MNLHTIAGVGKGTGYQDWVYAIVQEPWNLRNALSYVVLGQPERSLHHGGDGPTGETRSTWRAV